MRNKTVETNDSLSHMPLDQLRHELNDIPHCYGGVNRCITCYNEKRDLIDCSSDNSGFSARDPQPNKTFENINYNDARNSQIIDNLIRNNTFEASQNVNSFF